MDYLNLKIDHNGLQSPNRSKTYVNKILSKISGEYYKNYEINKIEEK
jgi:hypothetical protein